METRRKFLFSALLFLVLAGPASAQEDYRLFRERAGASSLLYRGQKAFAYNMLYNGTCYWTSPDFREGRVLYSGKSYDNVLLNIDAARQDLLVRIPGSVVDKVVDRRFVEEFTIDGHRFLNLQTRYGDTAPSGYWEVLHEGDIQFLCRVSKRMEQDVEGRKQDLTGYDGVFRLNVYQVFTRSVAYQLVFPDGRIIPVRRRRDILRPFEPSLRREIRRHLRQRENVNLMPFEQYAVEALKYLDSK
ncbi:MAG: hypothetical protein IJL93_08830 [Bacteroidales bacterium]|nr:hypothetical protein [Bacteroidales bacterium]